MTDEFPQTVREKAAELFNEVRGAMSLETAETITKWAGGRALCKAVQDGCLHIDPVELDEARWERAVEIADKLRCGNLPSGGYRRLVREGWTPPEPADLVLEVFMVARKADIGDTCGMDTVEAFRDRLAKLGLKIERTGQ